MVDVMKRILIVMTLLLSFFFIGCTEVSLEYLKIELNPGIDTVQINDEYIDTGAHATYGLKTLEVSVVKNNVDTTKLGEYEIVYQTKHRDLVQTIKRVIRVVDEIPPVISLNPGIDTIILGESWVDSGVEITDNSMGKISVTVRGSVNGAVGVYYIVYQAIDSSGNESEITRVVYVIE